MSAEPFSALDLRRARWLRLLLVLAGIFATQFIIYGPSLLGRKILLPLEILAQPGMYLPATPEFAGIPRHDTTLGDLVFQFETDRRFFAGELRAGRFPFWAPYQYTGVPLIWPKYSPFLLFQSLTPSPVIVAWAQMLVALTTGLGAYAFLRRALGVSFWPAALAAWCWPLTGFFVFWQGFPTCAAAYWLPWLLLAVHATVLRPRSLAPVGLSVATMLTLVSGHIDVAGQVLLISGLYALWNLFAEYGRALWQKPARTALLTITAGWTLGFLLAAPHVIPLLEYAGGGMRMLKRSVGQLEERPPGEWSALPQVVLPDVYGSTVAGSMRLAANINIESAAAAYMGVIATLFLAPLAWSDRRRRALSFFWLVIAVLGLAWSLGIPGFTSLLRLPGLRMMSHNRLVFATAFAVLMLSAIGLDALLRGRVERRWWFLLPGLLLTSLGAWSLWRGFHLPEALGAKLTAAIQRGQTITGIATSDDVARVQEWFWQSNLVAALLCGVGVLFWLVVARGETWRPSLVIALGVILVGDMLWFAHGRSAQADPRWYYPRIGTLEQIAAAPPGRVIGYSCLPAQLAQTHGLNDVRGYDSIDPARYIELLQLSAQPDGPRFNYAVTQFLSPQASPLPPDGVYLPPVLDLLGVRYVIFRGEPPAGLQPPFRSPDYWALINHRALPRLFIPQRIETIADDGERLARLASPAFRPREVAFVETPLPLSGVSSGTAEIISETTDHITATVEMKSPGLVVLADHWDKGWQATLNGQPTLLVRTNHALRGAVVPAGKWTLEFRYQPASVALSFTLAGAAALTLLGWSFANRVARRAATA